MTAKREVAPRGSVGGAAGSTQNTQRLIAAAIAAALTSMPVVVEERASELSALLTSRETEARLRCTRATLHNWRKRGTLSAVKFGRMVRYRREDIEALEKTGIT